MVGLQQNFLNHMFVTYLKLLNATYVKENEGNNQTAACMLENQGHEQKIEENMAVRLSMCLVTSLERKKFTML